MNLIPVEYNSQRILTTFQLAEAYGTDTNNINVNFSRNKDRFTVGKHYFVLEGKELKQFKSDDLTNCKVVDRANKLYLWTKKGAFLHAKSLNTTKAWEVYEKLIDGYFEYQEMIAAPQVPLVDEQIISLQEQIIELREGQKALEQAVQNVQWLPQNKLDILIVEALQNFPEGATVWQVCQNHIWARQYIKRHGILALHNQFERLLDRGLVFRVDAERGRAWAYSL